jgi:hypothetical protein
MIATWENESGTALRDNAGRPLTIQIDHDDRRAAMQASRVCAVTECELPTKSRDWCENHYRRWLQHGDPQGGRRSPVGGSCSVDGCDRPIAARTWCNLHYYRWKRTGELEVAPSATRICAIEGCGRKHHAYGWCSLHYERWTVTGDPLAVLPNTRDLHGPLSPNWQGIGVTYQGAHSRVRNLRGRANSRKCVDCGNRALHWSYDHADPDEVAEPAELGGKRYSAKPEHYEPRCSSCHVLFDNRARR